MSPTGREPHAPDNLPDTPPVRAAARVSTVIWWFLLVVLVLSALFAGVGRQLTQNIDAFRDDLTRELSQRLDHEVRIGSLSSRWFWLDPSFTAREILITNPVSGVTVARLQHLRIRIVALASLMRLRVVFEDFEADGLDIVLAQTPGGDLSVRGADLQAPVSNQLQAWLKLAGDWLSEPYVKVTRVNLGIRDNQGNLRHLDIPQLDLVYRRGLFRASGRAMRSGTTQQLASFALVGRHFFQGGFTGQVYLDVDSGRLFDGLIDEYPWRNIRVEGFDLGGEAWLTFRDGTLQQVNGRVQTPYLQLGVGQQSLAPLEGIQARFGWRRHSQVMAGQGDADRTAGTIGELHLKQLQWTWNGDQVPPFSVRLATRGGTTSVTADALPLAPLRRLVVSLGVLPEYATDALGNYRPGGYLDRMSLRFPVPDKGFELSGQLRQVSVEAYDGAPGAAGLNGFLYLNREAGYTEIHAGDEPVSLGFPELYTSAWSFPRFDGTVAWQLEGPVTRVFGDGIRMQYGENTRIKGAFDLRLERGGEDNLGLRIGVENGTADMLSAFVPAKVVNPGLVDWLTTAIPEADVRSGVFYGHGQIGSDAPDGSFVSSMWYEFDNATVRYDERWPAVTEARGRVEVHNGDTRVTLASGLTGGLTVTQATVTATPGESGTQLRVDAAADVPGSALDFWLTNSPVGDMAGAEARNLRVEGAYQLDLGMDLRLGTGGDPVVELAVASTDGTITYVPAGLSWQNVSGELTYHSNDGFSGNPLSARFFDRPVTIALSQNRKASALTVRQSGTLNIREALERAGADPDRTYGLQGRLDYSAMLDVGADTTSVIRVRSNLEGLAVNWPEPLAKAAGEVAPLEARIDPSAPSGLAITGTWENRMSFDLQWQDTGFDLSLDRLYLGPHTLTDIRINALDLGDRWVVSTRSERAVGRVVLPDDGGLINADFETVRLLRSDTEAPQEAELLTLEEQLEAFRSLDMGAWPDVDVTIADLQLNDDHLGRWSFRLRPEPYLLRVNGIEGRLKSLTLLGNMTWSVVNERENSRFEGTISGGQLADLDGLFATDIPLTNEQTSLELDLDWPGRPDEFALKGLSGSVSLRLDNGVILEQNNTAQVFRVFNLLNSDTLWRRLKLDFSDLYERGVAFDAISGKAQIVDGLITLDPELQVVGPSGAFKLSGSTDMPDETLDMRLVVVLPLTQNLPLAALLLGAGAPIGGALFVLDKVLGDPLSKLTSATYHVTGTWDDPKVDLQRVFDTGE